MRRVALARRLCRINNPIKSNNTATPMPTGTGFSCATRSQSRARSLNLFQKSPWAGVTIAAVGDGEGEVLACAAELKDFVGCALGVGFTSATAGDGEAETFGVGEGLAVAIWRFAALAFLFVAALLLPTLELFAFVAGRRRLSGGAGPASFRATPDEED